jgi:hypothetical protein
MTGTMLEFAFHEGGIYRMRLIYATPQPTAGKTSEDTDEVTVRFARLVPHQRIDQIVSFNSDDPSFSGEMRMSWILEPVQNGTLVTVRCEDVPSGIRPEDHQAGLASTLSNLATFTESAHDTQPDAPG